MEKKRVGWVIKCFDVIFGESEYFEVFATKKKAKNALEFQALENPEWAKDSKAKVQKIKYYESYV